MKYLFIIISLLFLGSNLFGQKKLRRTYGIAKMTETTVIFKDGNEINRYISDYEMYNKDGEWIEKVDLLPDGRLKKKETRKYEKGEVVEEIVDEPLDRGMVERKPDYDHEKYYYDKDVLIKKEEYNREGKLIETTEYVYNKYGDLEEERKFDARGNLKQLEQLEYDDRGLEVKKNTYNASEILVESKIYTYE